MDSPRKSNGSGDSPADRRLNSWKAIGAFFERDERTVRRWEAERGLPVHRVPGAGRSSVYAYAGELAEWLKTADTESPLPEQAIPDSPAQPHIAETILESAFAPHLRESRRRYPLMLIALVATALVSLIAVVGYRRYTSGRLQAATALPTGVKPAANPEAQDLYLSRLYYWNKRTPRDLNQALDEFTQSLVRDPNYAPAYVGLANCYNLLREYARMPEKEAYPRAIVAAQRAIALDDSLAEAHNSLAFADFYWSWDAAAAEREFRRAIALAPNYALAHHWYATFLLVLGRSQEALAEIETARQLDPQSSAILADKGLILQAAGKTEEATALLRQLEGSEPQFLSPHSYLAVIFLNVRNDKEYLAEAKKAATLLHDENRLAVAAAGEKGFAAGGGTGMLRAMLRVQQDRYGKGSVEAYELASTYCLLGEKQRALGLLETSVERHEARVIALRIDKNLDSLHDDATFRKLVAEVGLPPL